MLLKQTMLLIIATLYIKCFPMDRFKRTLHHSYVPSPHLKRGPSPNTNVVLVEPHGELFLLTNAQQLWANDNLIFSELAFQHIGRLAK